jgi:hypothetical protein
LKPGSNAIASALLVLALVSSTAVCGGGSGERGAVAMDAIAERYVTLVLAVGQHDPSYVDAYYGPPEWKPAADRKQPLEEIDSEAGALIAEVRALEPPGSSELEILRHQYLVRQLESMRSRIDMLEGKKLSFDEESQALYDATAPVHPESYFQSTLDELDSLLPGNGSLIDRLDTFRAAFQIPSDRLGRVFDLAIAECRARTLVHASLPPDESFTVEYVRNKSWSGYNWYQGNYRSLIQVNVDLPIFIDRAILPATRAIRGTTCTTPCSRRT